MICDIIAVGKIKEKYLKEGIREYQKRLEPFCRVMIIEVAEEKAPDNLGSAEKIQVMAREGERIIKKINPSSFLIPLCVEGEQFSSEQMAEKLQGLMVSSTSHVTFIIGGSLGLSDEVKARANLKLSFSSFTFPHQLMRLLLLEQLYRWFKIIRGEPYHR